MQYPQLPFSPPIPTSSASSNHATQQFPFPAPFLPGRGSGTQSPVIPNVASPLSFNPQLAAKLTRQSISVPPGESPFGIPFQQPAPIPRNFSPQPGLLQQTLQRTASPALSLNAAVSPSSPFQPDAFAGGFPVNMHQRHQSLQYPILPHQQFQFGQARVSPRLQDLAEADEETAGKSPSKTPEPSAFIRRNSDPVLQKEIDDAEYHLEEQIRSQLEHEDYSPHDGATKVPERAEQNSSTQIAPPEQPFQTSVADGPIHHPQPHSRGHSLSQKPYVDEDSTESMDGRSMKLQPSFSDLSTRFEQRRADDAAEVETNPSNLGTPVQGIDFASVLQQHQRAFSGGSNPWVDSTRRTSSHGSKPSLSKLNVQAPEFKFNPSTSQFNPGQFVFGQNTFQPPVFQAPVFLPNPPLSAAASTFSQSTSSSKINVNAPVFSPGQTDFNFSAAGPKFRADAPAFTPMQLTESLTSPNSGSESIGNRSSIFGNIDLSASDIVKPSRKSKAIPIVRPASRESMKEPKISEDQDGRLTDETRVKRPKAGGAGDVDGVALFAEAPSMPAEPAADKAGQTTVPVDEPRSGDDENAGLADTTLSSTIASETTDTKAAASPFETSPADKLTMNWAPFEFESKLDMQEFNNARPFGEEPDPFARRHKKRLSATAKPFVPGTSSFVEDVVDIPTEPSPAPALDKEATPATVERVDSAPSSPPVLPEPSPLPVTSGVRSGLAASRFARTPSPPPKPKGLGASRFASPPKRTHEEVEPASEAEEARVPEPTTPEVAAEEPDFNKLESAFDDEAPQPTSPPQVTVQDDLDVSREQTFEEIDAVMQQMTQDPSIGVRKTVDSPSWHHPSPKRHISLAAVTTSPPLHLQPHAQLRSDAPSPSPQRYRGGPVESHEPVQSTELEDPFVDPPHSVLSTDAAVQRLNTSEGLPPSEWDGVVNHDEQRAQFFDGRVNELVDGLLAARLDPLEKTLNSIQSAIAAISRRSPERRDRRSASAEIQESDADDEDDEEPAPRKSLSPRRDRRLEQIRSVVLDALNTQQAARALQAPPPPAQGETEGSAVLRALEELKEQFGASMRLDFRGEDLRNIVEDAVERRMPPTPKPDETAAQKEAELLARIAELERRLQSEVAANDARVREYEEKLQREGATTEAEQAKRRAAEDRAAELDRKLQTAETKIEIEIMNRSAFDQRIADLEDKLKHVEKLHGQEESARRAAEDRLSEVQRLLRISSEEEERLRETLEQRDQKIKVFEDTRGKERMRLAVLEAADGNAKKAQAELMNRVNAVEADLHAARQDASHWHAQAERLQQVAKRRDDELAQAMDENQQLHKLIDALGTQIQENERIRETWRSKFMSLQEDMARAAREITEENARRIKREQTLLARQETLDARLQAESRTRERLEQEMERLENGERQGMRAVSECKRLEGLLGELRTENHRLQQSLMHHQREADEARDSGAREVQRVRESMQAELDAVRESADREVQRVRESMQAELDVLREAGAREVQRVRESMQAELDGAHDSGTREVLRVRESMQAELDAAKREVNVVRAELEDQVARLHAQIDQIRLDADTAKAQSEMLLEGTQNSKAAEIAELTQKYEARLADVEKDHQNKTDDLRARYERQLSNTAEDAQRTEQNLLERLGIATSRADHLQDRVQHLEEKLEVAKEAALAAAQAAKTATTDAGAQPASPALASPKPVTRATLGLPEKISPQALRESILVLQEQLQEREQRIERLEQTITQLDPDAATKIAKRDDEIIWLRELLAVRHSDLQDIISALGSDNYDRDAVKDAAIRLKANLQMEEQERERAMNGGSAISLPNIAATIRDAATPRVAQAVGPLAAAWGNWRKSREPTFANLSGVLSSPSVPANARATSDVTPLKNSPASQSSFLSGLLTPPTSGARQTPSPDPQPGSRSQQPTAFGSTGRRLTGQQQAGAGSSGRPRGPSSLSSRRSEKMPLPASQNSPPPRRPSGPPMTPPMMRSSAYDSDAHAEEFDDAAFFDD